MSAKQSQGEVRWLDDEPVQRELPRHEVLRTPPKQKRKMIFLSHKWARVPTHYLQGRTMPCMTFQCEGCKRNVQVREKLYIYALCSIGRGVFVFESTDNPLENYEDYFRLHGTMRGAEGIASRPSGKEKGRVVVQLSKSRESDLVLPEVPDIRKFLCRLWSVAIPNHGAFSFDEDRLVASVSTRRRRREHTRGEQTPPLTNGVH